MVWVELIGFNTTCCITNTWIIIFIIEVLKGVTIVFVKSFIAWLSVVIVVELGNIILLLITKVSIQ